MHMDVFVTYVVTAFLFSLSPGSGCVLSLSNGVQYGFRRALLAILGLQCGKDRVFVKNMIKLS